MSEIRTSPMRAISASLEALRAASASREDDEWMYAQILERVGAIARGEATADGLTGSTTIRLAVGLIVESLPATNPNFPSHDDPRAAWEMLDRAQRVRLANPRFREPEWDAVALPY